MAERRKGREPKLPSWFRWLLAPLATRITQRRVYGLANRRGIVPSGIISSDTTIEYYTDKDQRKTAQVDLLELEAKPAENDLILKYLGTFVFVAMVTATTLCIGLDEVRAKLFPDATDYRPGNIAMVGFGVSVVYLVLFGWMQQKFEKMDQSWANNIDSFFGGGARSQMEAVRNCMREFKRFVKWRRYMRLMMIAAVLTFVVESVLILFGEDRTVYAFTADSVVTLLTGVSHSNKWQFSWSSPEAYFASAFAAAQLVWFVLYWYMWLYYTSFRDPTLQMCVVVNAIDRETVPPPLAAERR